MEQIISRDEGGHIVIPLWKGCVLVLTADEFQRALRRGKAKRRRKQLEKRQQTAPKLYRQKTVESPHRES